LRQSLPKPPQRLQTVQPGRGRCRKIRGPCRDVPRWALSIALKAGDFRRSSHGLPGNHGSVPSGGQAFRGWNRGISGKHRSLRLSAATSPEAAAPIAFPRQDFHPWDRDFPRSCRAPSFSTPKSPEAAVPSPSVAGTSAHGVTMSPEIAAPSADPRQRLQQSPLRRLTQ
jgi:hypothetical protein